VLEGACPVAPNEYSNGEGIAQNGVFTLNLLDGDCEARSQFIFMNNTLFFPGNHRSGSPLEQEGCAIE